MKNRGFRKTSSIKRKLPIVVGVLLFVVIIFFALDKTNIINIYQKPIVPNTEVKPVNSVDYSPATPSDNESINQQKQSGAIDYPKPTTQLSVTLTRVYQDPNSGTLQIRTIIDGTTSGTCIMNLAQNEVVNLTKNASLIQQNNIFTCAGFDIAASELPGIGEWTTEVIVNSGPNSAKTSQNIILEK